MEELRKIDYPKSVCPKCGTRNEASAHFCHHCKTGLPVSIIPRKMFAESDSNIIGDCSYCGAPIPYFSASSPHYYCNHCGAQLMPVPNQNLFKYMRRGLSAVSAFLITFVIFSNIFF